MSQWPKKEERGERKAGFKVSFISSSTDVTSTGNLTAMKTIKQQQPSSDYSVPDTDTE